MLLFNPGDIDVLALQMEKMISDEELRKTIARESILLAYTPLMCRLLMAVGRYI
jgi:hypothetical protein